jgi:hypothetical protein
MKKEFTKLERLNFAARAEVAASSLPIHTVLICILSVISILLAVASAAASSEVLAVRVFAALAALAGLSGIIRWRYTWHTFAMFYFALAALILLFSLGSLNSVFAWAERVGLALIFGATGYGLLARYASVELAVPLNAIDDEGWERYRARVRDWLKELLNSATEEKVFEVSTGSFWTGYFTYRFMRREGFWIVARFKKGNYFRLQEYRVLGPDAVELAPPSEEKLNIKFGKRTLALDVSPDIRGSLPRATI